MMLVRLFSILVVVLWVGGCQSTPDLSLVQGCASALVLDDSATGSKIGSNAESESRWPTRWGDDSVRRGTIIELDPAKPLRPIHLSRFHQTRSTDIEYADANQLAADIGITRGFKFKGEGPGSFLFIPNPQNASTPALTKDSGKQSKSKIPDLAFKFVSATKVVEDESIQVTVTKVSDDPDGTPAISMTLAPASPGEVKPTRIDPDEDYVEIQRTWFTYFDPKPKKGAAVEPKGTIVLMPGIFGTPDPIVDACEKYWRHQGYSILRMRSQPSRFTEHYQFHTSPEQAVSIAEDVAKMNDQRIAEGAYATKAAVDYLLSKRPGLVDKPMILLGMSGCAMMLPTVYAYAPESYDAAVLIAGGANFLRIAIESNYNTWIDAITFDFDPDPLKVGRIEGAHLEAFSDAYLKHSKLDAYHTATELGDIPVLMLHASLDQAVPASSGDLLYERLGKPERWSYPLGHELIFAGLPTQITRIDRWLREHVLEGWGD